MRQQLLGWRSYVAAPTVQSWLLERSVLSSNGGLLPLRSAQKPLQGKLDAQSSGPVSSLRASTDPRCSDPSAQAQRQTQLQMEQHQRYITSLLAAAGGTQMSPDANLSGAPPAERVRTPLSTFANLAQLLLCIARWQLLAVCTCRGSIQASTARMAVTSLSSCQHACVTLMRRSPVVLMACETQRPANHTQRQEGVPVTSQSRSPKPNQCDDCLGRPWERARRRRCRGADRPASRRAPATRCATPSGRRRRRRRRCWRMTTRLRRYAAVQLHLCSNSSPDRLLTRGSCYSQQTHMAVVDRLSTCQASVRVPQLSIPSLTGVLRRCRAPRT